MGTPPGLTIRPGRRVPSRSSVIVRRCSCAPWGCRRALACAHRIASRRLPASLKSRAPRPVSSPAWCSTIAGAARRRRRVGDGRQHGVRGQRSHRPVHAALADAGTVSGSRASRRLSARTQHHRHGPPVVARRCRRSRCAAKATAGRAARGARRCRRRPKSSPRRLRRPRAVATKAKPRGGCAI